MSTYNFTSLGIISKYKQPGIVVNEDGIKNRVVESNWHIVCWSIWNVKQRQSLTHARKHSAGDVTAIVCSSWSWRHLSYKAILYPYCDCTKRKWPTIIKIRRLLFKIENLVRKKNKQLSFRRVLPARFYQFPQGMQNITKNNNKL